MTPKYFPIINIFSHSPGCILLVPTVCPSAISVVAVGNNVEGMNESLFCLIAFFFSSSLQKKRIAPFFILFWYTAKNGILV